MKIALIAFRFGPSHGSILQTYALTKTLESLGHQVIIIDRQRPITFNSYINIIKRFLLGIKNGNLEGGDFRTGEIPGAVMRPFKLFIKKQFGKKAWTVYKDIQLKKIGNDSQFKVYLVGSDQTWRPKYVYDIYNYYLDFVPKERLVKRIAYAASFGTSEWEYTQEQENKCRELINRFDAVSVREDEGVALCRQHFNVKANHVLDPTLLLKTDDYRLLFQERTVENKEYVGFNFLDNSDEKNRIVDAVCVILKMRKKSTIAVQKEIKSKYTFMPSIEEWLQALDGSAFTVVDSFHATVFSIILHVNFITIANTNRGLSRFTSLLGALGLENRLITENDRITEKLVKEKIDWDKVDEKLDVFRLESISFLKNNLNKE